MSQEIILLDNEGCEFGLRVFANQIRLSLPFGSGCVWRYLEVNGTIDWAFEFRVAHAIVPPEIQQQVSRVLANKAFL